VTHLLFSISGSGRSSVGCRQLIGNVGSCQTRRAASADTPTAPSTEEVRTRSPRGPTNPGNPVERSRPHLRRSKGAAPTLRAAPPGGVQCIVAGGRCRPRLQRSPLRQPSRNGPPVGTTTGATTTELGWWAVRPRGGYFARGPRGCTRGYYGGFPRLGQSAAPTAGGFAFSFSPGQGWAASNPHKWGDEV